MDEGSLPTAARLVMAYDYGTTHSRFAYALMPQPLPPNAPVFFEHLLGAVQLVKGWPTGTNSRNSNSPGLDDQHAPSSMYYASPGRRAQKILWGRQVPELGGSPGDERVIRFPKLLLLPAGREFVQLRGSEFYLSADAAAKAARKQAEEIAEDFLRCLWSHAYVTMDELYGPNWVKEAFWDIIVTLPANWPEEVTCSMRRAVDSALELGLHRNNSVTFVAEPDAAALSVFATVPNDSWKEGDGVTIVDAGGATVDIVTYRVKSVNPLRVERCTLPACVVAGYLTLEKAFTEVLRRKVTEFYPSVVPLQAQEINGYLNDFSLSAGVLPAATGVVRNPIIPLTTGDLFEIAIESGIPRIAYTLAEQVASSNASGVIVKRLVPVGGYGSNRYLRRLLREYFPGSPYSPTVLELPTESCLSATVKGAVMRGIANAAAAENTGLIPPLAVLHPKSQSNYGICQGGPGLPAEMTWILAMDEEYPYSQNVVTGRLIAGFRADNPVVHVSIYGCDSNPPPQLRTSDVCEFANLVVPLDLTQLSNLACENGPDGRIIYNLPLDISIVPMPGDELHVRILHKDNDIVQPQRFPHVKMNQ